MEVLKRALKKSQLGYHQKGIKLRYTAAMEILMTHFRTTMASVTEVETTAGTTIHKQPAAAFTFTSDKAPSLIRDLQPPHEPAGGTGSRAIGA